MKIDCCHHCEKRHEKCHAHCDEYLMQKIMKIIVEAKAKEKQRVTRGIIDQNERMMTKIMHDNHLRRRR